MDKFIHRIENIKGMKYVIFGLKALFENSIETSTPNYIDICPVNTILSHNYVDGWRSRLSLKTTANLSKHFFLSGYYGSVDGVVTRTTIMRSSPIPSTQRNTCRMSSRGVP